MRKRVVVTGLGVVSPLGNGIDHVWDALINGKSGLSRIEHIDVSDLPNKIGGVVPRGDGSNGTFDVGAYIDSKEQRKMDTFITFGMAAGIQAVEDSGWMPEDEEELNRTGVMIGSGIGGLPGIAEGTTTLNERGPRRISPFFIPANLINLVSGYLSIKYGFRGPNHSVVTACATGTHAIGDAARMIAWGDADVMVAGGAESALCRIGLAGFCSARALSTGYNDTPEEGSRPWDQGRDGFVMGEGAGVVVLEEYEHAKARGAKIYGEILG
ncbi:MAG: beta-ketoacyl-ACP synthase II, partial [Alphaproteobacteria bacterium]|nr:beta-ketoacyl-ACP synthase II [Alphaproteobacteria bacterium]